MSNIPNRRLELKKEFDGFERHPFWQKMKDQIVIATSRLRHNCTVEAATMEQIRTAQGGITAMREVLLSPEKIWREEDAKLEIEQMEEDRRERERDHLAGNSRSSSFDETKRLPL